MERPILSARGAAGYLEALDNVLLLTHVRPDGDTIGSAAALCRALRDCGQTAYLLPNPEITATYAPYAAPYWAPEGWQAEHIVSVDIADASLLPENAQSYRDRIELAIDHHPSQTFFARNTCLEADSAACGEIVYEIIQHLTALTADIALPLYVAVSTDCGGFQYGNTTARTHRIAAALMDVVDVAAVNKMLFRTKSRVRLAMESRMVADMKLFDHQRVVVMEIPLSLRQEMQATDADIEELSALPALVEGTDCGVTLRELKDGRVKISLRTGPRVNATEVCALLGGGGHAAAAGATLHGTLSEVKQAVLQAIDMVAGED